MAMMYQNDWKKVAIEPDKTLRELLSVMDKAALQITLVVSADRVLLGVVTDGDVRRALLSGLTLEAIVTEVMNPTPISGMSYDGISVWQKKIQKFKLAHLPIIDESGYITGLISQKKLKPLLKNPVVLMLGGMGTRLRPLTENIPKPMLKVGNQPILETIVQHIAEQGFTEFYFCINYLGQQIRDYFGDGSQFGIQIHYIEEEDRMGTAGALSLLPTKPLESFIVMNGDLLTKVDLGALLRFHQENDDVVTACMREYSQQVPYGVIETNGKKITQLVEKPVYSYFVNAGIYAVHPSALDRMPIGEFYDMTTLIESVLSNNQSVGGFPITEYWMDIGQMPDYSQAQADYKIHFEKRSKSSLD